MEFKQFLIEIKKKELESLDLNRELHFNNIFGDKLRILIPLEGNKDLHELAKKLEKLGYEVDYQDLINKKVAYKKVQTKEGNKLRPEKVGGILQTVIKNYDKLRSDSSTSYLLPSKNELSEALDWWQKNSGNLKSTETGSSIIISRSPIDLIRMSDHDGISSCHSPSGSYFKCAKQEAKTGGAVAYVVKNSDLKNIDIQKPEIFQDKERKIQGIVPLERLRLRRFTKGDINLILPELRTYGIKNIGFLDAIIDWAKTSQKDDIDKIDPEKDYDEFDLAGGSYQDTDAGKVWSNFFNKSVYGRKDSIDSDDEGEEEGRNIEAAAERQLEEHKPNWKHIDVSLDVYDGDDTPTLNYSAYASFSIPIKLFSVDLRTPKYSLSKPENYQKELQLRNRTWNEVRKIIQDSIDIYTIESMEVEVYKNDYIFNFSIYEDDNYERDQLVRFEHFLDYIDEVDGNFEDHVNKVYSKLTEEGYLKTVIDKIEFENFNMERDEDGTNISSEPEKIGYLKDYPMPTSYAKFSAYGGLSSVIERSGKIYLYRLTKEIHSEAEKLNIFPFKIKEQEMKIFMISGMTQGVSNPTKATSGTSEKQGQPPMYFLTGWVYFEFEKSLSHNIISDTESIKRIKNLDKNWDFYIKKLANLFDMFVKRDMKALSQIKPNFAQQNSFGMRELEKDNDWQNKLSTARISNPLGIKLPKKPPIAPKSPYVQKQFKFESFKEWIKNRN
jgi:hypothetical protein